MLSENSHFCLPILVIIIKINKQIHGLKVNIYGIGEMSQGVKYLTHNSDAGWHTITYKYTQKIA